MLVLYGLTIFIGAALLFVVQPMMGRLVLPLLGGSPAVWNTAMVFYQAMLLGGYAYAHFATRWLGVRRQAALHTVVLLLPLLALPIAIPLGWTPPVTQNPIPWLLALLGVMVGLPFFAVSATSPLLQRWFSASGHPDAADPYFLYAASNCGSLLALVSYPVFIEPHLRLSQQTRWWTIGYGVLVVLMAICSLCVWRSSREVAPEGRAGVETLDAQKRVPPNDSMTAGRRWRWVLLAFVPCSLMLCVTTYITSEVAPIPLLWVIPLAIYLLVFILVFARQQWVPHRWMVHVLPFVVAVLVYTLTAHILSPIRWVIGLHLVCQFVISMVCLGELANDRPSPGHLTEFYLWLSVGGVLGGMFNALLAPVIFSSVTEYPVTLVLACWLTPSLWTCSNSRRQRIFDFAIPVVIGLLTANVTSVLRDWPGLSYLTKMALMYGTPLVVCLLFLRRRLRFALSIGCVCLAGSLMPGFQDLTLRVERSFFGVNRISLDPTGRFLWLTHGNTIHGIQHLDPSLRGEPLAYYIRSGPFGQAYAALDGALKQSVGVVGLGAGALASYGRRGERWTFFEIDPVVERMARDRRYFSFLNDCPANVEVVLGDARLSLQKARDGEFGILVLDAYSSDTIPLHLMTREAMALYLRKLAPDGVLIFHISNRRLILESVLGVLAQNAGLACAAQVEGASDFLGTGKIGSKWVVMAPRAESLGSLTSDARWQSPPKRLKTQLWTDDYASIFSVFIW
jgi:SAM-dependent methyltransferase